MHDDFRRTRDNHRGSYDYFGADFMPLMPLVFIASAFRNNASDGCQKEAHAAQE